MPIEATMRRRAMSFALFGERVLSEQAGTGRMTRGHPQQPFD